MPFLWRILFCLSLFQVGALELSAKQKKEEPIPVPPNPVSERVQGYVKESLNITLRATGRIEEPLDFLIRKPPRKGSLGELRRTGSKSAMVVYTPAADTGPEDDSFTFAARSVDSPVSAPARIDIELLLRPAALEFPQTVDFGVVPIGDSVRLEVCIKNTGGSDAPLDFSIDTPWSFVDPPPNFLAGGQKIAIKLVFEPTCLGHFTGRLVLSKHGKNFVVLQGSSTEALSWPAQGLVISPEMRTSLNLGITFTNLTDSVRNVEFEWPYHIVGHQSINIPVNGSKLAALSVDDAMPSSYSAKSEVRCRSGNFTFTVPITIGPTPAKIEIYPKDSIDLGEGQIHEMARGQFIVSNSGGETAGLILEAPQEIIIRPNPKEVFLCPGMSQEFEVLFKPEKSGKYRLPIAVGLAGKTLINLSVNCDVPASIPVEKLLELPNVQSMSNEQKIEKTANIAAVKNIELNEVKSNSCVLSWDVPDGAKDFLIEERHLIPKGNGEVAQEWVAWKRNISFNQSGSKVHVSLKKLSQNTFWMVRVIPLDEFGYKGTPSKVIKVYTLKKNLFTIPFVIWGPSLLIIIVVLIILIADKLRVLIFTSKSEA